jgi:hypothetical protein
MYNSQMPPNPNQTGGYRYYYGAWNSAPQQWAPVYRSGPHVGLIVWGVIFLVVGCAMLSSMFHLPFLFIGNTRYFWPLIVAIIGLVLIVIAIVSGIHNSREKREAERYWSMNNAQYFYSQDPQAPQPSQESPASAPESQNSDESEK